MGGKNEKLINSLKPKLIKIIYKNSFLTIKKKTINVI